MPGVERFPLSFQSHFSGNHFHHIVLGVHSGGRFGALGISRREDLMFKALEFRTLMDLVQEFEGAYRGYWHTLSKVRIGQYVSHDPHSVEQIEWKHSVLDVDKLTKEELRKELERHTRDMRLKVGGRGGHREVRVFSGLVKVSRRRYKLKEPQAGRADGDDEFYSSPPAEGLSLLDCLLDSR